MKLGTLVAATLVSIFTWCQPLSTQAGGKLPSFHIPSGGGGNHSNWGGGKSNWGGNYNGGTYHHNNYYNNQQTYPNTNSYYPYQQHPANNGWTQQYSAPAYSAPSVQSNSLPAVQANTVTTYKPQGMGSLQVAPMYNSGGKPNSSAGSLSLTGPINGGPGAPGTSQWGSNGGAGGGTAANGSGGGGGGNSWGPKGRKGKFAFAIVGGQMVQVFSSDDGGSWVTADSAPAGNAVADDSQTPPSVDLAGQNPTAAITLLNPLETRATVNFNLASQDGSLQSGFAAQATASDPQLIVFDRGGAFGQAQYTLSPGTAYRFTATNQGWDLRTVTQ
jgi:hypothetical protein